MAPKRFDKPIEAYFGNEVITIEPIRGLKNITAFEEALTQEILGFKSRLEDGKFQPSSPAHLFTQAVDVPRLLALCCPGITPEQMDMSTPGERLGALEEATRLNGLGHLTLFFKPSTLIELAMRMRAMSTEIMVKEFGEEIMEDVSPLLDFSAASSLAASTGTASTMESLSGSVTTS